MLIPKAKLEKIKAIIQKQHRYLLLTMLGQNQAPKELKAEFAKLGMEPKETKSLLEMVYNHNYLNNYHDVTAPKSHAEMKQQQTVEALLPKGAASETSMDHLHANLRNYLEKQTADVTARIQAMIHETNQSFKFDTPAEGGPNVLELLRNAAKSKLKTQLRDYSKDATRNWDRVVDTEVSNAISLGSADRISEMNSGTNPDEVYVYRIVVDDSALCKYCRKFYQDSDGTPKLYRFSEILANGSNFGKKSADWKPTIMATHPRERCSPILQLRPGWKVLPGGSQTFIGMQEWPAYLKSKLK